MAKHDEGSGTGTDTLFFRTTVGRTLAATLLTGTIVWIFVRLIVILMFDLGFTREVLRDSLLTGAFYVAVFAGLGTWAQRRRPNWVRISPAGIELAAARRQPVLVPWAAVEAVRFRWFGPFTELEVTPTSLDATAARSPGGREFRIGERAGRPTILTEVGLLRPGPRELRAELTRRLPAEVIRPK
ncbi:hypothetical protein ACI2K4_20145 [Micromonospora sp. NPDC050397]|uniref:hypothetical protein n=1 Tax=Micromonospora sp. NPDC050397 TaxID=3364279 RepID=UPI0038517F27